MSLYNVEVFKPDFEYRDSFQTTDITYEFDYLSLTPNKLKLIKLEAERGDYVRISRGNMRICGIVEGVSKNATSVTISYKNILTMFDVNVWADIEELYDLDNSIEEWLAAVITNIYMTDSDTLQNIKGLEVKTVSETKGVKKLSLESNINNLYEVLQSVLIKHEIVVNTDISIQNQKIIVTIGKVENAEKTIETNLPNVISSEFNIKKSSESVNKLTIINEENEQEQYSFYLLTDGTVTDDVKSENRITPVIFDFKYASAKEDERFYDIAYQNAVEELIPEEYDNLIEIECEAEDSIILPEELAIDQKVNVKSGEADYHTILTGIERNKTIKLIFGAIRLELTKKMKRKDK